MRRKSGTCLWALAAALWAQSAGAQTAGTSSTSTGGTGGSTTSSGAGTATGGGNLQFELVKIGDVEYPRAARQSLNVPVGKAGCKAGGTITVTVRNLLGGNTLPYLEAWLGTGNAACNEMGRSTRVTASQNCTKLEIPNPDQVQVGNRSYYDVDVVLGPTCDSDGPRPIYFLQLASENSNGAATSWGAINLKVDTKAPKAPGGVKGGTGQTVIPLTWEVGDVADTSFYYVVADKTLGGLGDWDAGPDGNLPDGANAECPSGVVRSGKEFDPSSIPDTVFNRRLEGVGRTTFEFNGQDFPGLTIVPVAVVAQDLAGNTSVMSEIVCLRVEPTTGFWKRYQDDGGEVEPGCACSAVGARGKSKSALAGVSMLLVLGWACARTRTRRRAR